MCNQWHLCVCVIYFIAGNGLARAADRDTLIADASTDRDGMQLHNVESAFQAGKTQIRVLLPEPYQADIKYPVIYVLPVEAGREQRYGDGLLEVKQRKLHQQHAVIFVATSFSHLPWYADHPSNLELRQESYLLEVVIPFVDKNYPSLAKPKGRHLLGFSKSGWGAWCLLLRHSEKFGRAVAWDAPLMLDRPGKYGSGEVFGTEANFAAYRVTELLRMRADKLHEDRRLILTGYGNFREEHQRVHTLMQELKIAHDYQDGPARKHDWHSGWVEEAVRLLLNETK